MAESGRLLDIKIDVTDFERLAKDFAATGQNMVPALRRAVNHTGDKARTQMSRALVEQTGLKYGRVREELKTERASGGYIVYRILARGGYISLKEFGARQTMKGVSAAPWGKRRVFPHAFISEALGGHVFIRAHRDSARSARSALYGDTSGLVGRHPIRKLWGPAIPNELIKGESKAAFEDAVNSDLPGRIDYEVSAILKGHAPK